MHIHDLIGIGLGPFNLSLACLSSTVDDLDALFLEQKPVFDWHPGMMLESAHLQTPFMSDLVTLADPTHPLSFLNYAKRKGKLYSFYIRENFFLLRREYNQYCQWATEQLDNLRFNHRVETIEFDSDRDCYRIHARHGEEKITLLARHLVLGTGPSPKLPECCEINPKLGIHSSAYLDHRADLQQQDSITIVGSGQSAAEIFHDLLQDIDSFHYELNWITRSARFSPLEYTKLTLEMTSPEYVDYFYSLPETTRRRLLAEQRFLYKGINSELINDIFDLLYTKDLVSDLRCHILTNTSLQNVTDNGDGLTLDLWHREQQVEFALDSQALILATGYDYRPPAFLAPLQPHIQWDDSGRFAVNRNYSIDRQGGRVFIQNAELHTHGFVTPDLGMACYRNSCILREILGYAPYAIEERIGFQRFAAAPPPPFLRHANDSGQASLHSPQQVAL